MNDSVHITDYKTFAIILCLLFILTGVTVGASYVNLGHLNVWIALFIASIKSTLVLLYFMHLKYESGVIKWSFISTIIALAVMISFTFWDIAFR